MKKYMTSLLMLAIFEAIAISLWLTKDNIFYLFNFSYIGASIALGTALISEKKTYARHVVQFLVGSYMLVYLGIICGENMQIEGFWYYLFLGVFEAATIHYAVAKIFGPLVFGRGWCGYACWTAMVLDLLPFKQTEGERKQRLGLFRYLLFALSLVFAASLFLFGAENKERIMWYAFLMGNAVYYAAASSLSLMRIEADAEKCVSCGKCRRVCPMNVEPDVPFKERQNRTECILCLACVQNCPTKALELGMKRKEQ